MKLKELTIDGFGGHSRLQLGQFNDGLTLVYGENRSGKSTVGELIRNTLYEFDRFTSLPSDARYSVGTLKVTDPRGEYQLSRDVRLNSQTSIRPIHTHANGNHFQTETLGQLTGNINRDLYDTVFNFSLRQTPTNAPHLASVLHDQLAVPIGPSAVGDDSARLSWQAEEKSRRAKIAAINDRIAALDRDKANLRDEIESARRLRHSRIGEIELQIDAIVARINEIQASSLPESIAELDREIARLRQYIDHAQSQQIVATPPVRPLDQHTSLYQRLDEIDGQIRRWRHVQSDIQSQRVRLRDEMLVWNELTLESDEHPYHTARAILVALESKVDEAERNANHWSDVGGSHVDASQLARTLGKICQTMREDLYGLCNELAHQYKHIRHKSAAAELKQLRRCYTEMGENIERLVGRRESVVREIRDVDPAGADAIVRSEIKFCECAHHAGYLEARRRFVGETPARPQPQTHSVAVNLDAERSRLATLEAQRNEQKQTLFRLESEQNELNRKHADLTRQRDQILSEPDAGSLKTRIESIEIEIRNLQDESNQLLRWLEQNQYVPVAPNSLLTRASSLIARASAGELTQVFLEKTTTLAYDAPRIEIQVRDRIGKVLNFSALSAGYQDQVYLALILSAKEQLKLNGIETPTIVDDAFQRIDPNLVTLTLEMLNNVAAPGNQIIALTQHRYLADRLPGVSLLELAPSLPHTPLAEPQRRTSPPPLVSPVRERDWGADSILSTSLQLDSQAPQPYPLSKYPRTSGSATDETRSYTVQYPFPNVASQQPGKQPHIDLIETHRGPLVRDVASVSVDDIGDRLDYVSTMDELTLLERVGWFDANQLRIFDRHGITSVGELLDAPTDEFYQAGISEDQLAHWQSKVWLMTCVPGLRHEEADILIACGITAPEHLDTSQPQQLQERIERFLGSAEGRRYGLGGRSISNNRIDGWLRSVSTTRSNWRTGRRNRRRSTARRQRDRRDSHFERHTPRTPRTYEPPTANQRTRRPDREPRSAREPRIARPPRMSSQINQRPTAPAIPPAKTDSAPPQSTERTATSDAKTQKLKFYLDLNDHIEAAPSIGPKTAERFEKIDVHTIDDFLKQTAESMASKINYKRISADVIRQWQHQARLVCRVPNLRGHDAQLLVACDITEPEDISTMQPKKLLDIIGPFSETKEGLKIIRNGKKPDLEEITDWINWAGHTRSIKAA